MMKTTFSMGLLSLGLTLLSFTAIAETQETIQMPKDTWFQQVKQAVPEPICKSFISDESISAQMSANHISYDKCVSQIPAIADKCQQKYYSGAPDTITPDNAEKWGRLMGECIGNSYATDYLYASPQSKLMVQPQS